MVLNSHSCCVFINADRLVHDASYVQSLETITKQVVSLARLIDRTAIPYAFALIFTQCDQLPPGAIGQLQIEEKIQGLVSALESVSAKYHRFYTGIPIVEREGVFKLQSNGVSSAFLWLVAELYKKKSFGLDKSLEASLQDNTDSQKLLPTFSPKILWGLGGIAALIILGLGWNFFLKQPNSTLTPTASSAGNNDQQVEKYEKLLKENPKNMDALVALANLYLEQGELEKAIPVLEKIAVIQPNNLDWQFNLAKLYELSDQTDKAEKIYDQMLSKNPKEFKALVGKAMLRQAKGDFQTANSLFKIAEDVAPSPDLKKKIRELSQAKPK